jgi:hypothetical protein
MDDPVVAQLAAYNAHDVDGFVASYAVDAAITNGDGRTLMTGHAQMREAYGGLFERHPDVHADVSERLREGAWVVDHELVRTGAATTGYVVAYRVRDGVIDRVVIMGD